MRTKARKGSIVVLVAVLMVALLGFGAFAVDVAQMQAYKSELRRTADAAVLAATLQLLHETQYNLAGVAAQDFVNSNPVMGDTVILSPLEYGRYFGGAFQPLPCNPACPSDSIRSSTAVRLTVTGSGQFYLAQFIGGDGFSLSMTATAWLPVVATPCVAPWAVTRTFWDAQFATLPSSGQPTATVLRNMPLVGSGKIIAVKNNDPNPVGTADVWFGAITLPAYGSGLPIPPNSAVGYASNVANLNGCQRLDVGSIVQGKLTGLDNETIAGVSGIGGLNALCGGALVSGFCHNSGGQIGIAVRVPIVDSLTSGTPCLASPIYDPEDRITTPPPNAVCFSVVDIGTFVVLRTPINPAEEGRVITAYAGNDTIGPVRGYAQRPILVQ